MLLIAALILLPAGCRKQVAETPRPLAEWLNEDTEAAMRYINRACTTLYFKKQTDSVMSLYRDVFSRFPHKPVGNTDSLVNQIGFALAYFNTSAFYLRKDEPFAGLLDSLRQSGHPFFTGPALGYFLAYQAFATERFNGEKAKEAAQAFAALPLQRNLSQEMMCCHLASWVLFNTGASADVYISMQLRAVEAFRKGAGQANITGILSQLSFFYRLSGEYDKAIDYSLQALDWELANNGDRSNAGRIQMYGALSDTYCQLFLYDKAFEALDKAIGSSGEYNNLYLCDLYRRKANLFESINNIDSALYYLDQTVGEAIAIKDSSYIRAFERERAYFFVREHNRYPDSLASMTALLGRYHTDSMSLPPHRRIETRLWYGQALVCMGQVMHGKQLMEQAISEMQKMQWNEGLDDAYEELGRIYVSLGMGDDLLTLFPTYVAMRDSLEKQDKINASIGANVRYETGRKEQENRVLAAEISLKERSLVYTRVILLLSGILLLVAIALIVQYRRNRRRERENHQSEIARLLSAQQEVNRRNEDLSQKLEVAEHTEVIDNVRQQLNPSLLSGDDETRFRQSFAALYPRYLPKLRNLCPEITKSDELVCMLIYLKQNTDEISLALGISRASVNSARSRIRKKLGLQKEDSLEDKLNF